jgi:hypothetical protein
VASRRQLAHRRWLGPHRCVARPDRTGPLLPGRCLLRQSVGGNQ